MGVVCVVVGCESLDFHALLNGAVKPCHIIILHIHIGDVVIHPLPGDSGAVQLSFVVDPDSGTHSVSVSLFDHLRLYELTFLLVAQAPQQ